MNLKNIFLISIYFVDNYLLRLLALTNSYCYVLNTVYYILYLHEFRMDYNYYINAMKIIAVAESFEYLNPPL